MRASPESIAAQASLFTELLSAVAEPAMREVGLTPSVFELLSTIRASGGSDTQNAIARRMGVTAPSLSEAIRLASRFVVQSPAENDRRAKALALTADGEAAVVHVLRAIERAESDLSATLTPDEVLQCAEILRKANRALARRVQPASETERIRR